MDQINEDVMGVDQEGRRNPPAYLRTMAADLVALADSMDCRDTTYPPKRFIYEEGERALTCSSKWDSTFGSEMLAMASRVYQGRTLREKFFGMPSLFGEPAWDILLDLYINQLQDRPVQVTDACLGSRVPSTTALRWIAILVENGLVFRVASEGDKRRWYLRLTAVGMSKMNAYIGGILKLADPKPSWSLVRKKVACGG